MVLYLVTNILITRDYIRLASMLVYKNEDKSL